jgi:signal transduction histidine kinase
MHAQVIHGLSDPNIDPLGTLFDLSKHFSETGVPLIVTDTSGVPTSRANLPFDAPIEDPRVRAYIRVLDSENDPVSEPNVGTIHYGFTPLVRGLRIIPIVQALMLALLLGAGVYAYRTRDRAEQERVWAGMARESAHQLGTPLSSLSGWLDLLRDREGDALAQQAVVHMATDLERLERVAHRFERIGRPPQREPVDLAAVVQRVADYFRARVPTLAHTVQISTAIASSPTEMRGDPVLLEWAVEALVKNAVDALAGVGGRISLALETLPEGDVRLVVSDDGPGIPRELRRRVFEAGFSTKPHGWGLGLALARRIVEEAHGGRIVLLPTEKGAAFQIIFPG